MASYYGLMCRQQGCSRREWTHQTMEIAGGNEPVDYGSDGRVSWRSADQKTGAGTHSIIDHKRPQQIDDGNGPTRDGADYGVRTDGW